MERQNDFAKINSINFKIGKVWNDIGPEIQTYANKTSSTFSRHVKKMYIDNYSVDCKNMPDCYICNKYAVP